MIYKYKKDVLDFIQYCEIKKKQYINNIFIYKDIFVFEIIHV